MLVRMAYWNCRQECWGEDSSLFRSGAVPIMQGHEGFIQAMLLATPDAEQRIAFTVWNSPESYQNFVQSPDLEKITKMFAHMYIEGNLPDPVEYNIRAHGAAI